MSFNLKFFEVRRNLGENDYDFHRRMTAETITSMAKHRTFHFYKKEFEHLPNKQTELQVTNEIQKCKIDKQPIVSSSNRNGINDDYWSIE
jgi:hypothetical protein